MHCFCLVLELHVRLTVFPLYYREITIVYSNFSNSSLLADVQAGVFGQGTVYTWKGYGTLCAVESPLWA